jgi:hypothetical protein
LLVHARRQTDCEVHVEPDGHVVPEQSALHTPWVGELPSLKVKQSRPVAHAGDAVLQAELAAPPPDDEVWHTRVDELQVSPEQQPVAAQLWPLEAHEVPQV